MRIELNNTTEFKPNSYFESLARFQLEKPEVFKTLSPSEKLTLTIYLAQKAKAAQEKQTHD